MKKIWGHTIVKNEDRYIWFAIKSVIDYLDKILIWDTGSTDNTVNIINLLQKEYPDKIDFKRIGPVDAIGLTKARQRMLDETKSDWLLILDGDEVWWEKGIKEAIDKVQNDKLYAIVTPVINVIGDIYHYQEEQAGQYQILGKKGHFNIRAVNRNIPGLHIKNAYPLEGFYDRYEKLIQGNGSSRLVFQNVPLMHFTYLPRSSKGKDKNVMQRRSKRKFEIGVKFEDDFQFPEVFYEDYPPIIISPWTKATKAHKIRSLLEYPIKKIKRTIL